MDRIFMILKNEIDPGVMLTLTYGYMYIHAYDHYIVKNIGIYLRSEVGVYRTIGPLVFITL